jgi:hypothetical protein
MNHNQVTLIADVMFVNLVPFLVSASRNVNLITIEHAPDQKASKLGHLLECIIRVYACAGFTIQTILIDNEFDKVKNHVSPVNMNTPAAAEHIGKIEPCIQVIKERSQGIICTLPYLKIPQMMLVYLLHFIVMWLNNFPPAMGISSQWSPREIILHHHLNCKHHCHAPFGAYCEVHEDHEHQRNSMKTQGTPFICLGPTGNIQSTYNFLSVVSGFVIKHHEWDELPAPQSVIDRVSSLTRVSRGVS